MVRIRTLQVKLTRREFEKLKQVQEKTQFSSISEYVRDCLFNHNPENTNKFMKFLNGLGLIQDIPNKSEIRKIIREELLKCQNKI